MKHLHVLCAYIEVTGVFQHSVVIRTALNLSSCGYCTWKVTDLQFEIQREKPLDHVALALEHSNTHRKAKYERYRQVH
jgi:hypothetical protein